MRPRRELPILRYVREFVRAQGERDDTDAQLLGRFATHRDADAFAELVARHGPLVWGVCRRQLARTEDAEDAFQATFLVLLRKASSLRRPERLANWLYGVACRTAAKARVAAATRIAREQLVARESAAEPVDEVLWRDVRSLLDDEVQRLPDRYRTPFVLCNLEGLTHQQAARQLGCPEGTVTSRLAWARQRLRSRLARRGLTLSASAVAATVFDTAGPAAVPATLIARIAVGTTPQLSARVSLLAEGVLQSMWLNQLKYRTVLLALTGLALAGVGSLTRNALAQRPQPADPQEETTAAPADAEGAIQVVRPKLGKDVEVTTPVQQVRVEPYYRADLRSRSGGAVKAVNVVIGSLVKQGDVLVEMDVPELLQLVREKNAIVEERRVELALAQKQFKAARATDVEVDIKAAQLEAARADLDRAKSLLDGATLRAPFDGVVVRRAVDPGSVVGKESEPLLILERQDIVTLVLEVLADDAPFVVPGAEVSFWLGRNTRPDPIIYTKVSRIAPSINAGGDLFRVEADLWNDTEASYQRYVASEMKKPEKERFADLKQRQPPPFPRATRDVLRRNGRLLLPNMSVGAAIAVPRYQNELFLPRSAFFLDSNQYHVAVVENGKVRIRPTIVQATGDGRMMFHFVFVEDRKHIPLTGKEVFALKDPKDLKDGQEVKTVLVPDWDKAVVPAR